MMEEIPCIERRTIKVVNRKLADAVSTQVLCGARGSKDFLVGLEEANRLLRDKVFVQLCSRRIERSLFKSLVTCNGELVNNITLNYWRKTIEENERLRFSQFSKDAFKLLKRIYKYDQIEKRDGSIVSKVLEGDIVISEEKEVNRLLIEHLKSVQRDPRLHLYEEAPPVPFPKLGLVPYEEMNVILGVITRNKALGGDLVSDAILNEDCFGMACEVFKDLWEGHEIGAHHFRCRLIALNKKHPDIPKKDQFRPIIVSSVLVKMLEARLVQPLRRYMVQSLHLS